MCPVTTDGIDSLMLMNLPDFFCIVRTNMIGNKVMRVTDKQLRAMIFGKHSIRMSCALFSVA